MLLSIAHYNRQLIGIALDRVLLSVHRAKPEYRSLDSVAAHVHGHGNQSPRRTAPLQWTAQYAGSVGHSALMGLSYSTDAPCLGSSFVVEMSKSRSWRRVVYRFGAVTI